MPNKGAGFARLFLLSPASSTGERARMLLNPAARFALAQQLQSAEGAPLGEVFAFLSGLYFRGKLAYASKFARLVVQRGVGAELARPLAKRAVKRPPAGAEQAPPVHTPGGATPGVFVITPTIGLQPPDYPVTISLLQQFAKVDIGTANKAYRGPLEATATEIDRVVGPKAEVVLLGSIATGKYVDILTEVFGERLLFPAEFVGRGDMSRGGLLLRCVRANLELTYVPVLGAVRHGKRPPRLEPYKR